MKNTFMKIGMIILTVISIACCISLMMVGIVCIRISNNLLGMIIGIGVNITSVGAFTMSIIQMKDVIQDKHITVTN